MELVEAMVAHRVMLFAKELSLFDVEIEGDCSRLITALNMARRCGPCGTLFGHVIDDCKSLVESLRSGKFSHVRREGNRLAHVLVRKTVLSVDMDVWVVIWIVYSNRIRFSKILLLFSQEKKKN